MPVIYGLDKIKEPFENAAITLGNFDGVHLGHQTLFRELMKKAVAVKGDAVVITFDPHPLAVLKPEMAPGIITPLDRKAELILSYGLDYVLIIPFTRQFAKIGAREFVKDILFEKLGMKELIVGYDYAFGRNREGNIDLLKSMGRELGFAVHVLDAIHRGDSLISSTAIRNLLREGNVARVNEMLARPFQVSGKIMTGRRVGGSVLGFPTANLDSSEMGMIPAKGVYAVEAVLDEVVLPGVCNVGVNPTFNEQRLTVEVHIFDFDRDIYGRTMRVNFIERLRDERKFKSVEELAEQINKDAKKARIILNLS
jgi:riboflavin kinase / FMN adenylyltransferase